MISPGDAVVPAARRRLIALTAVVATVLLVLAARAVRQAGPGGDARLTFAFVVGERVRVAPSYHWAREATGTVAPAPSDQVARVPGWNGHVRRVPAATSLLTHIWVAFDSAQHDASGNGPFAGGEIDAAYLERVDVPQAARRALARPDR